MVTNDGPATAPATQVTVSLVKTGQILGTLPPVETSIMNLTVGAALPENATSNVTSTPFTISSNMPPGTYTVRLTIDPNKQIAESNEVNNTFDIPQSLIIVAP